MKKSGEDILIYQGNVLLLCLSAPGEEPPDFAAETHCLFGKSSRLIRNSHFLFPYIMLCSLMYSGLKLEKGFQQLSWEVPGELSVGTMVGRYLAGFKMLLYEPWQIKCWDSWDGKGHHPKRSPWFPTLLLSALYTAAYFSWLKHNLSKTHSLFCIYQHINFQLCDMGCSSVSTKEEKKKAFFFFFEEMKISSGNCFLFYWIVCSFWRWLKMENGQTHRGINITAGESVLQGINDCRIFSLKTALNRPLYYNHV